MSTRYSHCHYCGAAYDGDPPWPRTCAACGHTAYRNPLPVAVALVPVGGGLVAVRRGIEPRKGALALPGGFIDHGENWRDAAVREVREEAGLELSAAGVREFRVLSAPDGTLLVFGVTAPLAPETLPPFTPTSETTERVVIAGPRELAFPLHTQVVAEYYARETRGFQFD